MDSCQFVVFISIIASSIAKGKTEDEINILSTFFSQLGDTLATILAVQTSDNDKNQTSGAVTVDNE